MIALSLGLVLAIPPKFQTWFFVTSDCPIAKRFTPEIKRIMKDFQSMSEFTYVYEDEGASLPAMRAHHREYNLECLLIVDPKHQLAKQFKIKGVPTVVIMSTPENVFYQGRIDDSYGKDYKWHPTKQHDLRNALEDLKHNRPVRVKSTTVIGCALNN
jgi:hypothetical protein